MYRWSGGDVEVVMDMTKYMKSGHGHEHGHAEKVLEYMMKGSRELWHEVLLLEKCGDVVGMIILP